MEFGKLPAPEIKELFLEHHIEMLRDMLSLCERKWVTKYLLECALNYVFPAKKELDNKLGDINLDAVASHELTVENFCKKVRLKFLIHIGFQGVAFAEDIKELKKSKKYSKEEIADRCIVRLGELAQSFKYFDFKLSAEMRKHGWTDNPCYGEYDERMFFLYIKVAGDVLKAFRKLDYNIDAEFYKKYI